MCDVEVGSQWVLEAGSEAADLSEMEVKVEECLEKLDCGRRVGCIWIGMPQGNAKPHIRKQTSVVDGPPPVLP